MNEGIITFWNGLVVGYILALLAVRLDKFIDKHKTQCHVRYLDTEKNEIGGDDV